MPDGVGDMGATGKQPNRRVTLQTVADAVGVSRMTVSNAYSRPDQLSAALREQILETAKRLGYCGPDPKARALIRGSAGAVGVVMCGSMAWAFLDLVQAAFLGAVAAELESTGQGLVLLGSSSDGGESTARNVAVDGALILSNSSPAVQPLLARRTPLVFVDEVPAEGCSSVQVDDDGGAAAATRLLTELGHRRIGIVTPTLSGPPRLADGAAEPPEPTSHVGRERLRGWLEPLRQHGLAPTIAVADHCDAVVVREMLTAANRPTAVVCFSDLVAQLVLGVAHDLGLRVPSDLSVIGFDDSPLAVTQRPALTTVRQDVAAKGHAAAAELRRAIDAYRAGAGFEPKHLRLGTELIVRGTTGAAPR